MTLSHDVSLTSEECEIIEQALSSYMISHLKNPDFEEVSKLRKSFAELLGKEN